jgi:Uma2 family endonuclease
MPESARAAVEDRIYAALNADVEATSEGTRHFRLKLSAYADLRDHFHRRGRKVFLACELAVLYPGEEAFSPDLLAVVDVADAERERDSWRVFDEGRGLDFVLELHNRSKADKDLVDKVHRYARLRIPEYFAFDCQRQVLRGWRLSTAGGAYVPIVPQGGRFPSLQLDLELAVLDGRLRFFLGQALVPSSHELIARLEGMVDRQQQALDESERQREDSERQREDSERQREDSERQLRKAHQQLVERILSRLRDRGIALSDEQRNKLTACSDLSMLLTWLDQALTTQSAEALLSG